MVTILFLPVHSSYCLPHTIHIILDDSHSDGIRCMQFNPVTYQLVSCTARDFGFWSADLKQVPKFQVESPVNDCSWSSDGHHLALALAVGFVSIRNRVG